MQSLLNTFRRAPRRASALFFGALFALMLVPAMALGQSEFDTLETGLLAKVAEVVPIGIAILVAILGITLGVKVIRRIMGS